MGHGQMLIPEASSRLIIAHSSANISSNEIIPLRVRRGFKRKSDLCKQINDFTVFDVSSFFFKREQACAEP